MSFNRGFICAICGPIPKANKKTVQKRPYNICPTCMSFVETWEKPINERLGHCDNCGNASFELAIVKSDLLRCCKKCSKVINTDRNNEVVREGKAIAGNMERD